MKKILKVTAIFLLVLILLLIAAPFIFRGNLEKMLKNTINDNLNATVAWEDLDLRIFSSFPQASLQLQDFSIINKFPFEGDTLVSGKTLKFDMGIMQLFKTKDLKIDAVKIERAFINIKVDSLGRSNYDIAIKDDAPLDPDTPESDTNFTFELQKYEIEDSYIKYGDDSSKIYFTLSDFQHSGKGDLSATLTNLDTETKALVSFKIDETEYLSNNPMALQAVIQMDLEDQKFTFLQNEAKVNDLVLTFDGFVKMNESNNEIDLTFKTPSSDFKNFLAVIPKTYLKQISNVQTTGNFTVNGMIKGIVDSTYIPKMDIQVRSENASFKYPDLPKTVRNINMDAQLKNETGLLKDTYLNIPKLTFTIDEEPFRMNAKVKNMTENAFVDLEMQGTINLANLKQVMPLEMEQDLNGIFKAAIVAHFDMESVEKERYDKMDIRGNATLTGFRYDAGFKNDLIIKNASISLQPAAFTLKELNATTSSTDIKASGNIQNLIPFIMKKQDLKGRFTVESNNFNVNDFMAPTNKLATQSTQQKKTSGSTEEEAIKIPDFLDATLDFKASTVIYDNLHLKNAKGTATIKDEVLTLNNFTSDIFGGRIALSGNVSTKTETPTFVMNLDLNKIDITESFNQLDMFQYLVPIAKALHGSLNTEFKLRGNLTKDLAPNLATLAGDAVAQVITAEVDPNQAPLLAALGSKVSFLDLKRLGLKDVSTHLTFKDGNIEVKPFHFDVKGIDVTVAGTHGLDKTINYNLTMDVPAKYLGSEVTKLLQKIDPKEAEQMSINLPVGVRGSFTNPQISMNLEGAVKELTQTLIAKEKDKLIDKGKSALEDLIRGKTKKDSTSTNTPSTDKPNQNTQQQTTEKIKGILDGIMGGKKGNQKDGD